MQKSLFAYLLAILLILSGINPAFGAVKAGEKCTKINATSTLGGKKYTCIKSRTSLVWNQGVLVKKKPLPLPSKLPITPTPSATPTKNPNIEDIDPVQVFLNTAVVSFRENKQNIEASSDRFKYYLDPSSRIGIKENTTYGLSTAYSFYSYLGLQLPKTIYTLLGASETWIHSISRELPCPEINAEISSSAALPLICSHNERIIATIYGSVIVDYSRLTYQMEMPHELAHLWQFTAFPSGVSTGSLPRWLTEGSAQVLSRLNYSAMHEEKSPSQWFDYWYEFERTDMKYLCKNISIKEMEMSGKAWPNVEYCAYANGQLAVEYFIYKYGFETFKKLFSERNNNNLETFPFFFESLTGDSLISFYTEADVYLRKRGW